MSVPEPPEGKTLLQSFINNFNQQNEAGVAAMPGTSNAIEEVADSGIAYFVDEEGRYYYQPADDDQNIVSLPMVTDDIAEAIQEDEDEDEEEEEEPAILSDFKEYQTVTLMPSENSSGGVSYVLVVQEDPKQVVNINIQGEKNNEDVYNFEEEDEEAGQEGTDDDNDKSNVTTRGKHSKYVRPRFTCNFCSYTSHRRYLLLRHMKSHSEDRPHKCEVCERGFKTVASLQNHVNMHNGVKPHVCKYCNSPFTTSGELVRHIRYRHTHEKPHKCTECDYASVELSKLRRHVRCHTGERPYQCPHCTYASPDTFKLKRHLRTHTGEKPYKCDHCNLCFTQSNSLKAHKLIHNVSEKPVYACELCPTKCGRKTDLRIHIQKLHTSDKPLKCKICAKTFPDRYSCKVHYKTHEGEKCFKCEICMYASTTIRRLKSHMLKHTDEKPFVCDQCDQRFRQKQLLRRHQNLYHNPDYVPKPPKEKTHTCHECHRTFAHKGNLIRHLAVHDPESGHHERVLALKLGRQKKAKRVDGQLKEVREEDSDSEDNDQNSEIKMSMSGKELQSEYVTVSDGDNQQYVVLEVIHLEDGTEQQVTVMAPEYIEEDEQVEEEEEEEEEEEDDDDSEDTKNNQILLLHEQEKQKSMERTLKLENDVDTCFGFDEDVEDGDDEVPYEDKVLINLV